MNGIGGLRLYPDSEDSCEWKMEGVMVSYWQPYSALSLLFDLPASVWQMIDDR